MASPVKKPKDPDIDGGYAWAILTGCFIVYLCLVGSLKCYGILYAEMVTYYQGGSGNTAWIGSMCLFLMLGLGPFANSLSQRFSFRKVCIVGGLFLGGGYIASAFVTEMEYLYLTFGMISGIGYGLTFAPCSTIISFFFEKRRALANGITVSASGIGVLTLPFLYQYIIEQYTLRGTFLIIGGILLNISAAACIFVQPKVLQKIKKIRQMQLSAAKQRKKDGKHLLNGDINEESENKIDAGCCAGLNLKWSLFRNSRFLLYVVCLTLCMNGYGNNLILIPSHLKALGYDQTKVVMSVSIMGGCEIISRIVMGWLADGVIKPQKLFLVSMYIGAIVAFMAPFFDNFIFFVIYSGLVGIFPGSFWSFMAVMLIDVVGIQDFSAAFGLLSLCLALGSLISQPAIGWLRDINGNWNAAFYVTGCLFLCAGLIVFEPCFMPKKSKEEEESDEESPRAVIPLRTPSKRLDTSMSENTDSLLDEDNDVSFSSQRISKIYRPYKPPSPPSSPKRTSAPLAATGDI